ncbi:rRNA biogenesis protein RRP5-like [Euwallacea similis]|uniref:rRNA biogenesis protein RRP5-like n=1 Tax=Euwallacea similis TaxID=1736056 RepID=UPI00344EF160
MGDDESFPRGGRVVVKRPLQETDSLFNLAKPSKAKKNKKSKKDASQESSEGLFEATLNIKGTLSYKKVQTGMVILGCVRQITNFGLEIELPGLCFVSVIITEISDPFTRYLNQQLENNEPDAPTLKNLFSIGEFLPVKITNIETHEKGVHLNGSINPREIYSELNYNSFKKDMLVWACISSKTDHGYEMSLGVKNSRAFLPFKNIDQDIKYGTGKPMWCTIHKADCTDSSSIIRLSAKTEHIKASKCDINNLHSVIPGAKVEFVSDKITPYGIQGKFNETFIGYIDETFLAKPLKRTSDYREGRILKAYILYVEPTTKIAYLTLRSLEKEEKPELNIGDVVRAEVFHATNSGVFFSLPGKNKGFVTNKRLINSITKKPNANLIEAVNLKFSVDSTHQCRILDYNHISRTYICTPEMNVVKEKAFTASDLSPGQLVQVTIVAVKEEGIVVETGHVKGFVPNLHVSNIEYTSNVKKRFKEGQQVSARVLSGEDNKILFTLKPSLVENKECLTNIDDAEAGKKYMGVVAKMTDMGALIVFYANTKAWLRQKGLGKGTSETSNYFFVGQVVNVYISKKDEKINVSLSPPKIKKTKPNVGGKYRVIVKAVINEGIKVKVENSTFKGLIPNAHLAANLSLCQAVKNTIAPGDKLVDIMFIGGSKPLLFSRRESLSIKVEKPPRFDDLANGSIVRCSYQGTSEEGILVLPLIQDNCKVLTIPEKYFDDNVPELHRHQLLLAKVIRINKESKELVLSVKMQHVFDKTVETTLNTFSQYLNELSYLYKRGKKLKWDICKFRVGDVVQGKVEKLGPNGGCLVCLNYNVKAIATQALSPNSLKIGDTVSGVIIAQTFEKQYLDICIKPEICAKINPIQDGNVLEAVVSSRADKLLVKDECLIVLLRHSSGNKQLVYLPTKLHENDFEGCGSFYEKKQCKICVCGQVKKFLVGMSTKLFVFLEKWSKRYGTLGTRRLLTANRQRQTKNEEITSVEKEMKVAQEADSKSNGSNSEIEEEVTVNGNEVQVDVKSPHDSLEKISDIVEKNSVGTKNKSVLLPGINSFFDTQKVESEERSSSEDEDIDPIEKKKKKLTTAERAELMKQEEERLSTIEKELADPTKKLETAEQFDRILLSKPDSAELWSKYISFHIAASEIGKARAVAKRALETINMTLTEAKFEIWMALLNLENMYGTKELFDECLEEALKYNDALQVYLKVIQVFAESAKYSDMEEKINRVRARYKQYPSMWLEIGKTYYQIGKFKEARNCKDRALKSIIDKKSQMMIIVRFAIMEFKYGEPDQGAAIFETILMSEPKKINIWTVYIDQLVKKDQIDEARRVLERSVSQTLPLKSMKSLFMKFRKFEESHGTPETIEAVKQRAQEYVAKFSKA